MNNIFPRSINKTDLCLQPSARNHRLLMFQALVQWTSRLNVLERHIRHMSSSIIYKHWYKLEMLSLSPGRWKQHHTFRGRRDVAGREILYSYLVEDGEGLYSWRNKGPKSTGPRGCLDGVCHFMTASTAKNWLPFSLFALYMRKALSPPTLRFPSQWGRKPPCSSFIQQDTYPGGSHGLPGHSPNINIPRVASGTLGRHILEGQALHKHQHFSASCELLVPSGLILV